MKKTNYLKCKVCEFNNTCELKYNKRTQAKRLHRTRQRVRIARSIKDIRQTLNITATAQKDAIYSLRQLAHNYPKL